MRRDKGQRRGSTWVFVYGTLLRGECNHHLLSEGRFIGESRTMPCFSLHDMGAFPGMVRGGEHAVEGEVYEVDADTGWLQMSRSTCRFASSVPVARRA